MAGDPHKRRRLFHFVLRVQIILGVVDQLQRVPGRGEREKQVLCGNQNSAPACSLECFRRPDLDRKSTRLNSSHSQISYAVFCLKKIIKLKDENDPTSNPAKTYVEEYAAGSSLYISVTH